MRSGQGGFSRFQQLLLVMICVVLTEAELRVGADLGCVKLHCVRKERDSRVCNSPIVPVVHAMAKGAEEPLVWRIARARQQVLKPIAIAERRVE